MAQTPRPPVLIDRVLTDPDVIEDLLVRHAPYRPVQRYMSNRAEYATLSGSPTDRPAAPVPVAPVFRGDWALGGAAADGVEELLGLPAFVDGARRLFDAEIVRPHTVYVNLTWQLPFTQGRGHVDIPAFRGFDRTTYPVTFLTIMGRTGLFEEERIRTATAVAWFYGGADGGFEYWPDGPDEPSVVHEGDIDNTAVVGDNDAMWHRVRPLGRPEDGMVTLDLDSELRAGGDGSWRIVDGEGAQQAEFGRDRLRVSLSWKAEVLADDAERARRDDRSDDLDGEEVLRRIGADLRRRGVDLPLPPAAEHPWADPDLVAGLAEVYMDYPA